MTRFGTGSRATSAAVPATRTSSARYVPRPWRGADGDGDTGSKLPCAEGVQVLEDLSPGFPVHWQNKLEDLRRIFRECESYAINLD